jgi:broad specificity phosphatase PhoE
MKVFLYSLVFLSAFSTYAQSPAFGNKARIYLVRHGEKQGGDDPVLTEKGNKRAGDLLRNLKGKKVARIYVTEFRRTQQTGDSMRIQSGIDTVQYLADTSCTDLLMKIKANNDLNNTILIIGHSNTIPMVIRKLGMQEHPAANIPDNEFDNLFLLTFKQGKASLKKTKYGQASLAGTQQ